VALSVSTLQPIHIGTIEFCLSYTSFNFCDFFKHAEWLMTIPQISARTRGPLAVTVHEVGRDSSKSSDRVRVYVVYPKVGNLLCL
jgi:hypothetical protein